MAVHFIDTTLFGNSVGTEEMRAIFDEQSMLQCWIDGEVALAQAQAELGVIPSEAADVIARAGDINRIDLAEVQAYGKRTGHSLLGLLTEFRKVIDSDHSRYLHFGATTQDVIDTGTMLMIKKGYDLVIEKQVTIMEGLSKLVVEHADTVMVGRTHGGHGLPITFGFKAAIWLSELSRQLERWLMAKERILVGNFTGAVGTFASWGEKGPVIQEKTLEKLGLGVPDTVWHSSRDRVAEVMTLCSLYAGTAGRIGREIYNLSKTEVQEILEPGDGKIGSSTMPHKKNPIHSEWIMVLERSIRANASTCLEVMGQENERDASRWKNEWITVPESFVMLSGILNHLEILVKGMTVNKERMQENTNMLRGMLLSEQVMFLLETHFALPTAHEKVYQASVRACDNNSHLVDELLADSQVADKCSREDLLSVMDAGKYVGQSSQVALSITQKVEKQLTTLAAAA